MKKCTVLVNLHMSCNNKINANIRAIIYSFLMPLSHTKAILQKFESVFAIPIFFFKKKK